MCPAQSAAERQRPSETCIIDHVNANMDLFMFSDALQTRGSSPNVMVYQLICGRVIIANSLCPSLSRHMNAMNILVGVLMICPCLFNGGLLILRGLSSNVENSKSNTTLCPRGDIGIWRGWRQ